jgi:hypothetical protein
MLTIDHDDAWEDIDVLVHAGLDTPEEMLGVIAEGIVASRDLSGKNRAAETGRLSLAAGMLAPHRAALAEAYRILARAGLRVAGCGLGWQRRGPA